MNVLDFGVFSAVLTMNPSLGQCATLHELRCEISTALATFPGALSLVHNAFPARVRSLLRAQGAHFEATGWQESSKEATVDFF